MILLALGCLALYFIVYPIIRTLFIYSPFATTICLRKQLKKAGSWAVITGSSDGIGKQFAFSLAKDGLNVFLLSYTQAKLEAIAEEIKAKHDVEVRVMSVDFSKPHVYSEIRKALDSLSIACLVNNVGVSYDHPDEFSTSELTQESRNERMINCNCLSMTQMSRIVAESWESSPVKTPGSTRVILNIGSFSGCLPTPYLSVYAATKAFVASFTESLHEEMQPKSIFVQAVMPLFIATKMSKVKRASLLVPSAASYAESALNQLGVQVVGQGYLWHELVSVLLHALPRALFVRHTTQQMLSFRKRALAKAKSQ